MLEIFQIVVGFLNSVFLNRLLSTISHIKWLFTLFMTFEKSFIDLVSINIKDQTVKQFKLIRNVKTERWISQKIWIWNT